VSSAPFRYRLRVRYGECDGQKIVFNARYGEYADAAMIEYQRALWGVVDGPGAVDMRLARQATDWFASARFDDVLELAVSTAAVGTTSFTIRCEFRRWPDGLRIATTETVYVATDAGHGRKRPITDAERAVLVRGAPGVLIDCAASALTQA